VRLSVPIAEISKAKLIGTMLGQELSAEVRELDRELSAEVRVTDKQSPAAAEVALDCRGLSKEGLFDNINLQVRSGEIVCLTGLVGAKRSELVRAIFGVEPADRGEIYVYGEPVKIRHPLDAIRLGIGFVPEDRRRDGLFMNLSLGLNMIMAHLSTVSRIGLLSEGTIRKIGNKEIADLGIIPPAGGGGQDTATNGTADPLCGDPAPNDPTSPPMASLDYTWPTMYQHNGGHTITATVNYQLYPSGAPGSAQTSMGVDLENFLITWTKVDGTRAAAAHHRRRACSAASR